MRKYLMEAGIRVPCVKNSLRLSPMWSHPMTGERRADGATLMSHKAAALASWLLRLLCPDREAVLMETVNRSDGARGVVWQRRPKGRDFRWVHGRLVGHLLGRRRIGLKLTTRGGTRVGVFDLDAHEAGPDDRLADGMRLVELLVSLGASPYISRSRRLKGFHIWLFFDGWVNLDSWHLAAKRVLDRAGLPLQAGVNEVFPQPGEVGRHPFLPYFKMTDAERSGTTAFVDLWNLRPLPLQWFLEHVDMTPTSWVDGHKGRAPRRPQRDIFTRLKKAGRWGGAPSLPSGPFPPGTRNTPTWQAALRLARAGLSYERFVAWHQENAPVPCPEKELVKIWKWAQKKRPGTKYQGQ